MKEEVVLTFSTTNHAILAEQLVESAKIPVRVMPLPGTIRAGCGLCLRLAPEDLEAAKNALNQGAVPIDGQFFARNQDGKVTYEAN